MVVAANWHHVEYYLPEYNKIPFGVVSKWELGEGAFRNDAGEDLTATPGDLGLQIGANGRAVVVIFDPDLLTFNTT